MLFSLLKHYLDTDTARKVSQSVYCFTTFISHGVENCFPRLWGTGISDAIFIVNSTCLTYKNILLPVISFKSLHLKNFQHILGYFRKYKNI